MDIEITAHYRIHITERTLKFIDVTLNAKIKPSQLKNISL